MTARLTVGTPNWGGPLNGILDAIEAKADAALAGLGTITVGNATATAPGVVELATTSEAVSGTDTVRAVTPAGLAAAIAALVNAAPGTLDTLNELAASLGNDANFAATMTAALAGKISTLTYANAAPGTRFTLLYNGTGFVDPVTGTVALSRPSSRTNIYFDLVGGSSSVVDPAWMINGDGRDIVV